jgi:hypothetical protein
MPEYIAMAKANQSWLAWRAGELDKSQELGREALKLWEQLPVGHGSRPFEWLARWHLMAIALQKSQLSTAIDDARLLLSPDQQRLAGELTITLEQAVKAWNEDVGESARALLNQSIELAQQMHYM